MQVADLVTALESIAPTRYAEAWDNVGLLVGDPAQPVTRVMLTIDLTPDVAREVAAERCDAIVAYHPPIFHAMKRIVAGSVIFDAVRSGVAIYSPHTALDTAPGGVNDLLADAIGITPESRRPLRLVETQASQYKLITFVPSKDVEKVSDALFAAGAGRIGSYTRCSFLTPGTGTFYGAAGTSPAVGQSGQLERTAEVKIETVLPIAKLEQALDALRATHPYEEPAFDLVRLAAPPEKTGLGRIGALPRPTARAEVIDRIKAELGLSRVLVAGPTDGTMATGACGAGACGDLLDDALKQKVDLYLTGEMRHHDALKAAAAGMTVVCTLHSNSERAVLRRLQAKLTEALPGLHAIVSTQDRDPFAVQ